MSKWTTDRFGNRILDTSISRSQNKAEGKFDARKFGAREATKEDSAVVFPPAKKVPNPQEPGSENTSLPNSSLTYVSFPNDIENLDIPYTLIKVYEVKRLNDTGLPDKLAFEKQSYSPEEVVKLVQQIGRALPEIQAGGSDIDYLNFIGSYIGGQLAGTGGQLAGRAGAVVGFAPERLVKFFEELAKLPSGSLVQNPLEALKNFSLRRNVNQLEYALALPMPENLAAQYQHNFEELKMTEQMGVIGGIAQAMSVKNGLLGSKNIDPYIMEAASAVLGNLPGVTNLNRGIFFGTTGLTINPQLEMIYTNPSLRQFQFDFVLTARNSVDSAMIANIINQLKFYSHPEIPRGLAGRFFIPPAQFELEFYTRAREENVFLFKTKKCALRDMTVDYTSTGTFASFIDGSPVQVRLSLMFQEVTILSREDIATGAY